MDEYQKLIAKLDAAPGPDRNLDGEVISFLRKGDIVRPFARPEEKYIPKVTESIDEAVRLIGACLEIGSGEGKYRWYVDDRTAAIWPDQVYDESDVDHKVPAIGLVICLLHALKRRKERA